MPYPRYDRAIQMTSHLSYTDESPITYDVGGIFKANAVHSMLKDSISTLSLNHLTGVSLDASITAKTLVWSGESIAANNHIGSLLERLTDNLRKSTYAGKSKLIWTTDRDTNKDSGWDEREREEEKVNDNLAELKIYYAAVARYKSKDWQTHIFRELDRLLRFDAWGADASRIKKESFTSMMKFIVFAQPHRLPGLAVGNDGNVAAGWKLGEKTVVVEFKEKDDAIAIVSKVTQRGKQKAAWQGNVGALKDFLSDFGSWDCLDEQKKTR